MNKIVKFLSFSLLFMLELLPQTSTGQSHYIKLDIKFSPPDTTNPEINLQLPTVLEGYPIYSRDAVYMVNGLLDDDSKKIRVTINGKNLGYMSPGPILLPVKLDFGENKVNFNFSDKANNVVSKIVTFNYDPNADVTPPILTLNYPFSEMTRGIQVVQKDSFDSLASISGRYSDQSNILGIWVNGNKVDSINDGSFYYPFLSGVPDTVNLKIADVYGNLSTYDAQLEDVPDIKLEADLGQITFHALVICINSYSDPSFNNLDGPTRDGQNLAKVLNEYYNFYKSNIKILKSPTRTQIVRALDNYRKRLTDNDNLLIFYAGHGFIDKETETGFWLPSDAKLDDRSNWMQSSSIRDYLKAINTQHTLVISDACFGGSLLREFFPDANKSINEIYKNKSRKAIISGDETAPDRSVFSEYLILKLKDFERPYFTAQDLFNRIKEPVMENSKTEQIPQYKSIPFTGDEGTSGDFVFVRNTKKLEKK